MWYHKVPSSISSSTGVVFINDQCLLKIIYTNEIVTENIYSKHSCNFYVTTVLARNLILTFSAKKDSQPVGCLMTIAEGNSSK